MGGYPDYDKVKKEMGIPKPKMPPETMQTKKETTLAKVIVGSGVLKELIQFAELVIGSETTLSFIDGEEEKSSRNYYRAEGIKKLITRLVGRAGGQLPEASYNYNFGEVKWSERKQVG